MLFAKLLLASSLQSAQLTLEQAIARAYEVHPDLVAADARARRAHIAYEQLQTEGYAITADLSGRLLGSQGGILSTTGSAPGTASIAPIGAGTIGLTVPIWNGGKTGEALRAANTAEQAAYEDVGTARTTLTIEVVRAFWAARQAELAEDIQQQATVQAQRAVAQAQAGKAAGRQTEHDVDQADQAFNAAQSELFRQKSAAEVARAQLGQFLQQDLAEVGLVGDPPEAPAPVLQPLSADVEAALGRRADFRAATDRVTIAEAQLGGAKGDYWPQLSFKADYQHGNNLVSQTTGARSVGTFAGEWDALLQAQYNLFDLGKTRRNVESADQSLREARATQEGMRSRIRTEIASAWTKASGAQQRLKFSDKAVELAERHHKWTSDRRDQGFGLAIEVEDARSKLLIARTQRLNARIEYVVALAELKAALGTL